MCTPRAENISQLFMFKRFEVLPIVSAAPKDLKRLQLWKNRDINILTDIQMLRTEQTDKNGEQRQCCMQNLQ